MLSDDTKSLDTYDGTTVKYLGDYIKDVQALIKPTLKPTLATTLKPTFKTTLKHNTTGGSSTLAVSLVLQILAFLFMSFVF